MEENKVNLTKEEFENCMRQYYIDKKERPEIACLRLGQYIFNKTGWEYKTSYEISDQEILRRLFKEWSYN